MTEIEELKAEIAKLRAEVETLKADRSAYPHYNQPPTAAARPPTYQPYWAVPFTVTGGQGGAREWYTGRMS